MIKVILVLVQANSKCSEQVVKNKKCDQLRTTENWGAKPGPWIALLRSTSFGYNIDERKRNFRPGRPTACAEWARSSHVCVGFLRGPQLLPTLRRCACAVNDVSTWSQGEWESVSLCPVTEGCPVQGGSRLVPGAAQRGSAHHDPKLESVDWTRIPCFIHLS